MPAVKHHFVGASGSQYLCERYDPGIHCGPPDSPGVIVLASPPHVAPRLIAASAVDDLSEALRDEAARKILTEEYSEADIWFCVRADETGQTRQRVALDLNAARF